MELDMGAPCIYARYYNGWCPFGDECPDLHHYSDGKLVKPFTDEERAQALAEHPELEEYYVVGGASAYACVAGTAANESSTNTQDWTRQNHSGTIRNADAG